MLKKIILIATFLISANTISYACSCGGKPTVLEMFDESYDVLTAKVVSIEDNAPPDAANHFPGGVRGAHAIVQKVYKGNAKPGDKVFFEQGSGYNCIVTFKNNFDGKITDEVGMEFLVYDRRGSLNSIRLNYCTRLGDREDYQYLDNLDKVKGKTRVSGWYRAGIYPREFKEKEQGILKNATIRFINQQDGKVFTTTVDEHGFYEIYDLPSGSYVARLVKPLGIDIDFDSGDGYYLSDNIVKEDLRTFSMPFEVAAGSHTSLSFHLFYNNPVNIKIIGADGKPRNGVDVGLISVTDPDSHKRYGMYGTSDADGIVRLTYVPPGRYYLAANPGATITAKQPIPIMFYPSVLNKKDAFAINVPRGGLKRQFTLRVPHPSKTYLLEGRVTYADGTPVKYTRVDFKTSVPKDGFDYSSQAWVKEDGFFQITVLAGAKGHLMSEENVWENEFVGCPETYKSLKEKYGNEKPPFKVSASLDVEEVKFDSRYIKLMFPFTPCPKQK